jgi:hypothetical protein
LHATDNRFMVIDFHRYLNRFKKPERWVTTVLFWEIVSARGYYRNFPVSASRYSTCRGAQRYIQRTFWHSLYIPSSLYPFFYNFPRESLMKSLHELFAKARISGSTRLPNTNITDCLIKPNTNSLKSSQNFYSWVMTGELVGSHERLKPNYNGLSPDTTWKHILSHCFIWKV